MIPTAIILEEWFFQFTLKNNDKTCAYNDWLIKKGLTFKEKKIIKRI